MATSRATHGPSDPVRMKAAATISAGPGGCYAASASIGYDGTFVQRVPPPDGVCSGGVCACTWHWWTGFFQ